MDSTVYGVRRCLENLCRVLAADIFERREAPSLSRLAHSQAWVIERSCFRTFAGCFSFDERSTLGLY